MGEAKRRKDRFGGKSGAYEVAFRQARTVFAFRYDPGHQSRGAGAVLSEAVHYPRIPSVFDPDLALNGTDDLSFAALDSIDERGIPAGAWVLVDPTTLGFVDTMPDDRFRAAYVQMTGTHGWFAERGGEETFVIIDEQSRLISEGGDVISDPIAFSRGKVRRHGDTNFPADAAFATQSALVVLTNGEGATQDHLAHLTALSIAARSRLIDLTPGANADARFFWLCQQGDPFPFDTDLEVRKYPDVAYERVMELARFITKSDAARRYCKANGSPITIFVDLVHLDEQIAAAAVGDFVAIAAELGISDAIGGDAVRTVLSLSNPAVGPYLARLDRYFASGTHHGAVGAEGARQVEVVDVDGNRHLVRKSGQGTLEIIVWSLPN
jgi:hypothetical protein